MAFSAQAVANEFIDIAGRGCLDPMKLQKLVYFAHGWHLAILNAPLTRQCFEAWQFGPVIPELYRALRSYGASNVTDFARLQSVTTHQTITPRVRPERDERANAALEIIHDVWDIYGRYSAIKLSNSTHMDGTPWAKWYDPNRTHVVIPNDDIKAYFARLQAEGKRELAITANS